MDYFPRPVEGGPALLPFARQLQQVQEPRLEWHRGCSAQERAGECFWQPPMKMVFRGGVVPSKNYWGIPLLDKIRILQEVKHQL